MCGLVGAISKNNIVPFLVEGLKHLEYRGYDSAGIAVINKNGLLKNIKSLGKVDILLNKLNCTKIDGSIGIAHTRWATHGKPNYVNAHPHIILNRLI